MADEIEQIIIRYVVDVDEALTKSKLWREEIAAVKAQIESLASTKGFTYQEAAKGLTKAFGQGVAENIKTLQDKLTTMKPSPEETNKINEQIEAQKKAYLEYQAVVTAALKKITAEELQSKNQILNAEKELQSRRIADLNALKGQVKARAAADTAALKEAAMKEKADLDALKQARAEYFKSWNDGKVVMSAAAKEVGARVQELKVKIQELAKAQNISFAKAGEILVTKSSANINEVNQGIKELTTNGAGLAGVFSRLGTVGSFFFGSVLGITAISVVRQLINLFKELIQAGFDYAKALVRLNISTNILQEKGYNVTLRETYQLITDLNREFPIFTRKSIVEGVGYIQLLSQNLELTNEQMKNMASVSSALAVVLGKDVNDAARELALFLSSGYGEALQRAGILASKGAVMHELLAMGVRTGYNETSAAIRAQAGYNVIMRDAIKLLEKSKEIQQGNAYAADRLAQAWNELKNAAGLRAVPSLAFLYNVLTWLIKAVDKSIVAFGNFLATMQGLTLSAIPAFVRSIFLIRDSIESIATGTYNFDELIKKYEEDLNKIFLIQRTAQAKRIGLIAEMGEDSPIGAGSAAEEEAETIATVVADLYTGIKNAQDTYHEGMRDAERDFWRDMAQINLDAQRAIDESWIDYYASAYEIARRMNDDFIKEDIDYAAKVAKAQRELASQREDIETKYRDRELKDERDFQEKMRRLREDFIMDLEDALRERDARQVLRLIRQFNLDRTRLERERDAQRQDRQREYRREIEELEQQRQEKLRVLYEEHMARYAEIKRQEEIELRELEIKHNAEMDEINRRLKQEQDDRKTRWDQQKADLELRLKETLDKLIIGLTDQYNLTEEMLRKVGDEYTKLYGKNGVMEQAINYALAYLEAAAIKMAEFYSQMDYGTRHPAPPVPYEDYGQRYEYSPLPGSNHALGASDMLVTSPQILKVGEIPELINITPLNRLRTPSVNSMGDKGGTITLDVWLSPDLEARVVDSTLQEAGNIMLNVQRRR